MEGGGLSKPTGWPTLAVSTNILAEAAFIALCANRVTAASLHKPPPPGHLFIPPLFMLTFSFNVLA